MKLFVTLFFLLSGTFTYCQSQAKEYPDWVYNPQAQKGMISAIANVKDADRYLAMKLAEEKAKKELAELIELHVKKICCLVDSSFCISNLYHEFITKIKLNLPEELLLCKTREMHMSEKRDMHEAIILIDLEIKHLVSYIIKTINSNANLKLNLEKSGYYNDLLKKLNKYEKIVKK